MKDMENLSNYNNKDPFVNKELAEEAILLLEEKQKNGEKLTKVELSEITGLPEDEITTEIHESWLGKSKFHYGNLPLDLWRSRLSEGVKLPEIVVGYLDIGRLRSTQGLELPKIVTGYLDLGWLEHTIKLPEKVGGNLDLGSLTSIENLNLPETVNGNIYLDKINPEEITELIKRYPQYSNKIVEHPIRSKTRVSISQMSIDKKSGDDIDIKYNS